MLRWKHSVSQTPLQLRVVMWPGPSHVIWFISDPEEFRVGLQRILIKGDRPRWQVSLALGLVLPLPSCLLLRCGGRLLPSGSQDSYIPVFTPSGSLHPSNAAVCWNLPTGQLKIDGSSLKRVAWLIYTVFHSYLSSSVVSKHFACIHVNEIWKRMYHSWIF